MTGYLHPTGFSCPKIRSNILVQFFSKLLDMKYMCKLEKIDIGCPELFLSYEHYSEVHD